jgi:heme-degrading monooxygenase HmoA
MRLHARLTRYRGIDADLFQPSLEWFEGRALPSLAGAEGYRTTFLGMAPDDGNVAVITFWDSKVAVRESDALEEALRVEAASQIETGRGRVVDRYEVVDELHGAPDPVCARFVRWSGLNVRGLEEARGLFRDKLAPSLSDLDGFSGAFIGEDSVKGKLLGVSLWDSPDALGGSAGWEREARARFESATGPRRQSIAETYEVTIAPELAAHSTV